MNNTFGFIGTGNMGGALARGAAKTMAGDSVFLADGNMAKAQALADQLGCRAVTVAEAASCGYVFLGVKPQHLPGLMQDLAPILAARDEEFVLVSMAAGVAMADIRRMAGGDYPVIRIMPNTPAAVGSGVILYDTTENVSQEALQQFLTNMAKCGWLDPLPEKLIDAGSAVSGCGPAFVALFIEALADGGVMCGLPRDKAMAYAARTLEGTAKLLLETGNHPGQLKDAVCSPGGSTIVGVKALEEVGLRSAAINAVEAAYVKTKELGK